MARRFDGTTAFELGSATLNFARVSMSVWIKPLSIPANAGGIFGFQDSTGAHDKTIHLTSTGIIRFFGFDGSSILADSTTTATVGQWMHILAVADGTNLRLYINGTIEATPACGNTFTGYSDANLRLGGGLREQGGVTNRFFDGIIQDAVLWNEALTGGHAKALAHGADPLSIRPDILQVAWMSRQGAGGVQIDSVGPPGVISTLQAGSEWGYNNRVEPIALVTDLVAPDTNISPPLLTVDVDMFAPVIAAPLFAPFFSAGVGINSATVFEGEPPPFVPPSLPPTLPPGSTEPGPGPTLPPLSSGGLAGIRFYQGPPWRWVVTDLNTSQTLTFLDRLAFEVEARYILNRSWTAKLSAPADNPEVNILDDDGFPFVNEGDRKLYGFRREGDSPSGKKWVCRYSGTILQTEDTGLTEDARTILTASDPWQLLYQRPMVNIEGDFPDKAGFFSFNDTQVSVIALTFLRNTIINHGEIGIDMSDETPAWSEDLDGNPVQLPGTSFWGSPYDAVWNARTSSEIETTTQVDMAFQQAMSVGEVWDQLIQTGLLDIILTPIHDPIRRPGYTHEISIYNRAGEQATDAVLAWDKPSRNLVRFNHLKDGFKRSNSIRYYEQQGGKPVAGGVPFTDPASITRYGEYWIQQFFPGRIREAVEAFAELQLLLRANGVDTVTTEPSPERAPFLFSEYFLGDTVPVYASSKVRQAVAGFQRLYGVVLTVNEDAYEQIPQLLVSPEET